MVAAYEIIGERLRAASLASLTGGKSRAVFLRISPTGKKS
jgi:hypothetical protein